MYRSYERPITSFIIPLPAKIGNSSSWIVSLPCFVLCESRWKQNPGGETQGTELVLFCLSEEEIYFQKHALKVDAGFVMDQYFNISGFGIQSID